MPSVEPRPYESEIGGRVQRLREALATGQFGDGSDEDLSPTALQALASDDRDELPWSHWGQWANWASWTKVL